MKHFILVIHKIFGEIMDVLFGVHYTGDGALSLFTADTQYNNTYKNVF